MNLPATRQQTHGSITPNYWRLSTNQTFRDYVGTTSHFKQGPERDPKNPKPDMSVLSHKTLKNPLNGIFNINGFKALPTLYTGYWLSITVGTGALRAPVAPTAFPSFVFVFCVRAYLSDEERL